MDSTNEINMQAIEERIKRGVVRSRSERDAGGFEGGAVLSIVKQDINSKEQILAQILANAESPVELLIRKSYKVTANTAFLTDHFEVINAEKRQWRELKFQEKLATRITELERFASEKVLEAQKTLKERNDKELLVTSIRKKAFMADKVLRTLLQINLKFKDYELAIQAASNAGLDEISETD